MAASLQQLLDNPILKANPQCLGGLLEQVVANYTARSDGGSSEVLVGAPTPRQVGSSSEVPTRTLPTHNSQAPDVVPDVAMDENTKQVEKYKNYWKQFRRPEPETPVSGATHPVLQHTPPRNSPDTAPVRKLARLQSADSWPHDAQPRDSFLHDDSQQSIAPTVCVLDPEPAGSEPDKLLAMANHLVAWLRKMDDQELNTRIQKARDDPRMEKYLDPTVFGKSDDPIDELAHFEAWCALAAPGMTAEPATQTLAAAPPPAKPVEVPQHTETSQPVTAKPAEVPEASQPPAPTPVETIVDSQATQAGEPGTVLPFCPHQYNPEIWDANSLKECVSQQMKPVTTKPAEVPEASQPPAPTPAEVPQQTETSQPVTTKPAEAPEASQPPAPMRVEVPQQTETSQPVTTNPAEPGEAPEASQPPAPTPVEVPQQTETSQPVTASPAEVPEASQPPAPMRVEVPQQTETSQPVTTKPAEVPEASQPPAPTPGEAPQQSETSQPATTKPAELPEASQPPAPKPLEVPQQTAETSQPAAPTPTEVPGVSAPKSVEAMPPPQTLMPKPPKPAVPAFSMQSVQTNAGSHGAESSKTANTPTSQDVQAALNRKTTIDLASGVKPAVGFPVGEVDAQSLQEAEDEVEAMRALKNGYMRMYRSLKSKLVEINSKLFVFSLLPNTPQSWTKHDIEVNVASMHSCRMLSEALVAPQRFWQSTRRLQSWATLVIPI